MASPELASLSLCSPHRPQIARGVMTDMISTAELAELYDVTLRTVKSWIQKGCPCERKPSTSGGKPRVWFDSEAVANWLAENDLQTRLSADATLSMPAGTEPPDPDIDRDDIDGALARQRFFERNTGAMLQTAIDQGNPAVIRKAQRIYNDTAKQLLDIEKQVDKIKLERGALIALEDVLQEQVKIDMAIKNQFLTLPKKVAADLARCTDANEIESILRLEIDDCLRHIAEGEDDCLRHIAEGEE